MWSDSTVAHAANIILGDFSCYKPCCAFVTPPDDVYGKYEVGLSFLPVLSLRSCFSAASFSEVTSFQLCEKGSKDAKPRRKKQEAVPLLPLEPSSSLGGKEMALCPSGHFSHCFLAVDEHTACWEYNDVIGPAAEKKPPLMSQCRDLVVEFPVHFVCPGSGPRLSYTLVCDHRQDCWDNSDEGFCVFQSCTDRTPLKCSSTQQVASCFYYNSWANMLRD